MRIAFLIQCHKNAEQINCLTKILSSQNDDVYIHLDRKSLVDRKEIHTNDAVILLPFDKSVSVDWGAYSQCEAILTMISTVIDSGRKYDYIWLISGQDFPIKKLEEIKNYLSRAPQTPYIHIISSEHVEQLCFDKRNDIAYPPCLIGKKIYQRILRRLLLVLTGGKHKTFCIFKKKRPVDVLYYGSTWWCLPTQCVKQMVELFDVIEGYRQYFSTSLCADESFFQTLFMQTKYAGEEKDILTYVDWTAKQSSPKTFSIADCAMLMALPEQYLFARKVDFEQDSQLAENLIGIHTNNF